MEDLKHFFDELNVEEDVQNQKCDEVKNEFNKEQLSSLKIDEISEMAVKKLKTIEKELNEFFLEREEVIKDSLRALVIGQHMFLYGPPGTGKSLLVYSLCQRIENGNYFEWLLNKTSDPAEILGPYSIKSMEQDKFLRKTDGKLPEAHIAFIDEIWKSNEPTLNILLPLLNEKVFYNDGKAHKVPLITMFCASNEIPEDESLNALYDRIIFRNYLEYVKDSDNKIKMFKNYIKSRSEKENLDSKTTISLIEILALQQRAKFIKIPNNIYIDFIKLLDNLEREGIVISDRRKNEALKVLQGNALIEGRQEVIVEDFTALKNILWKEVEQIYTIDTHILKIINPYEDKVKDYMRKFSEIKNEIEKIEEKEEKIRATIEAKVTIQSLAKRLEKLAVEAKNNGKDNSNILNKKEYVENYNMKIMKEVLGINLDI